jgi:hypothetical protein
MIGTVRPEVAEALSPMLGEGEELLGAITAPGSTLVLTTFRLIIIREGRSFRPKSGVRAWELDPSLRIHVRGARYGAGSLLIERDGGATSFFVADRDWLDATALVAEAHRLSAREHRSGT